jgi:riboflavin synthase
MFTGIIEEVGIVKVLQFIKNTAAIEIEATVSSEDLQPGSSIAVNGVCLTVRERTRQGFQAELSQETLVRSNLGQLRKGSRVNLERPLLAASRLGGHFVQGHVDSVGTVLAIDSEDDFANYQFSLPPEIQPYVVEKGSIAVDGISLTVAQLRQDSFQVAVIPHTLENTNLNTRRVRDLVNLECDVLAKYVESILKQRPELKKEPALTIESLKEQGY